ncbi:trans-sialidase, putative [Trypanosoma cruzi marinkellei]|uniref:Trans-sialidase, putative n=1 Tax=Trypanosoma cruzi marinkellei TaxID=85056 RepID=K2MW42_TRYCR|nr:trans-sialidase, putative [Trypanosoma cruzi marinkellei]
MLSRVAAVKAPRTYNRRCVTGSSGRRREGRESERQRPNMSRRVFTSAVLLLLVVMMSCGTGAVHAVESKSGVVQLPQWVDVFVPGKTQVQAKKVPERGVRDSYGSPSLVSAGGVMALLAKGVMVHGSASGAGNNVRYSDVVAGYANPAATWSSLVAEVSKDTWAHTVFSTTVGTEILGVVRQPTTVAKDNKAFLLVGSYEAKYDEVKKSWESSDSDIQLLVGEATQSTPTSWSGTINWGEPKSLLVHIDPHTKDKLKEPSPAGGAGVLMENGTLVFPLVGTIDGAIVSVIAYSVDDGSSWVFQASMPRAHCFDPRITEWDGGQILMIVECENSQSVFESRDMGITRTAAVGTLPGVWVKPQSGDPWDVTLRVEAIITAAIEGMRVMLYTQKRYNSEEKTETALYLWVTNNNRTFFVGPLFVENTMKERFYSTLLYSDDALHLLQERVNEGIKVISLARLTEELKTVRSVLKTWAQLDAHLSALSTPTVGLVGLLSNAASGDDTWLDDYRCVNAKVMNGVKVHDGFRFTGFGSGAVWSVNNRENNGLYAFVNHDFTLVATVTIHKVPKMSTTLLGAVLAAPVSTLFIGLSYGSDGVWETVLGGETTKSGRTWEPGREYQVALVLQDGNRGSLYVDAEVVGGSETLPTPEAREAEISDFYFVGGEDEEDKRSSSITVRNVFLYNRPLSAGELKMVKRGSDGSMRGGVSRVLLLLLLWGIAALY